MDVTSDFISPLSAELNPICHLLALLGAHHIIHVSGLRVTVKFEVLPTTKNEDIILSAVTYYSLVNCTSYYKDR